MKTLDRFILKSFVGPFIAILFVVVFILMMQFLWLYIDELVGKGLGMKVILEFLMWGSCTLLPLSLPLATLLASMMTLGTMGENNELLAIKAAGISLTRVLTPMMFASAAVSVGAFFAANDLIPVAYNNIYTLRDDIGKTKEEIKIPTGTFYDGIDGYILRIESRDDETRMMHGVMVYNHTGNKGNTSLTVADSAMMKMSEDKTYLSFTLYDGCNYEETNIRKYRDTTIQLQKIEFSRQSLIIPLKNYAFQKSGESRFDDEVKSMNLKQLLHCQDSLVTIGDGLRSDHLSRMKESGSLRWAWQLDTASARRMPTALADFESLPDWTDIEDRIRGYERAAAKANEFVGELSGYGRDVLRNNFILRRADIEILKKFAVALACFIFFFIGAPLGALIRKGGLGASAIISVLFFVFYWVIDITGTKLARDGAVSASSGVFISSYILFPLGLFLTWKTVNDSPLFNADKVADLIRKIKNIVMGRLRKTRIVFMGTPEFAVASLDALVKGKYNVVAVVTVPDKASGRGLKVNESAVKKYAVEHGLPVLQPEKMKDPEFQAALAALRPDLFVVVAFRMLPKSVWAMPRLGTFNLHAALLPQYRGAAPINWAVINGENMTGVTTFMIDEGIDTGHIMMREQCRISETDTSGDIHDRLMEIGARTVVQTVDAIIDKNVELRLQKSFIQGSEVLRGAPKLSRELCHIDWDWPSRGICNLIRGLSPYPGAFTEIVREGSAPVQMKIFSAEAVPAADLSGLEGWKEGLAPGTVLTDGRSLLAVTSADGAVSIRELQISGKKRMDTKSFLAGWREASASCTCTRGTSSQVLRQWGKA